MFHREPIATGTIARREPGWMMDTNIAVSPTPTTVHRSIQSVFSRSAIAFRLATCVRNKRGKRAVPSPIELISELTRVPFFRLTRVPFLQIPFRRTAILI